MDCKSILHFAWFRAIYYVMKDITDSQFYMWRTLFAIVHVDDMVTEEEVHFMAEALEDIPFTPDQIAMLEEDMRTPQDVTEMFKGVTDAHDQNQFFQTARALVHIDGDYGAEEQEIMLKLQKARFEFG